MIRLSCLLYLSRLLCIRISPWRLREESLALFDYLLDLLAQHDVALAEAHVSYESDEDLLAFSIVFIGGITQRLQ